VRGRPKFDQSGAENAANAPRERILRVARTLFCRDGIHATGIDRILAEADASKMTLYGNFRSKEALVREVLQQEGEDWRRLFFSVIDAPDGIATPLGRVIDAIEAIFQQGPFHGCAFMNAIAEHTKGEAWLRKMATDHHAQILAFLEQHAAAAHYPEPAILARQLLLLIDGTMVALMVTGEPTVLTVARRNLDAVLTQR
jgi:AcrR family transcriptional regulator